MDRAAVDCFFERITLELTGAAMRPRGNKMNDELSAATESASASNDLLCCPFCGLPVGVICTKDGFQIVGCIETSMLCPNPKLVVYPDKDGKYDYKWWNRRA